MPIICSVAHRSYSQITSIGRANVGPTILKRSERRWHYNVGPTLICWANHRRRRRANIRPMWAQCWANVGPMLGQHFANDDVMLGQHLPTFCQCFGSPLGLFFSDLLPMFGCWYSHIIFPKLNIIFMSQRCPENVIFQGMFWYMFWSITFPWHP